jgi:hypothetical protein
MNEAMEILGKKITNGSNHHFKPQRLRIEIKLQWIEFVRLARI